MSTSGAPTNPHWWRWTLGSLALTGVFTGAIVAATDPGAPRPARVAVDGGEIALELMRVRDGVPEVDPSEVEVGDPLVLRLTCPLGPTDLDVVVFAAGAEPKFPIGRRSLECGDRIRIPGTFAAESPGDLVACVSLDDGVARKALSRGPFAATVCAETRVIGR